MDELNTVDLTNESKETFSGPSTGLQVLAVAASYLLERKRKKVPHGIKRRDSGGKTYNDNPTPKVPRRYVDVNQRCIVGEKEVMIGDENNGHAHKPHSSVSDQKRQSFSLKHVGRTLCFRKRVRVYLPNFKLPKLLIEQEEKSMIGLQILLRERCFDVDDRDTLAFFLVGWEWDIHKAVESFLNFYSLVNEKEFKFPNRKHMENIAQIEGFVRHRDGTFGGLYNPNSFNISEYAMRFAFCHFLHMVDFGLSRSGVTVVVNLRGLDWRSFEPLKWSKNLKGFEKSLPFQCRKLIFLDPGFYAAIALKVFIPLLPSRVRNTLHILSVDEATTLLPDILLPPSVTPTTSTSPNFVRLTTDEQIKMPFIIEV